MSLLNNTFRCFLDKGDSYNVYLPTQVATVSVFTYFLAALFGCQYLIPRKSGLDRETFPHINVTYSNTSPFIDHTPDLYFPWFTCMEFLCYMGWIKVAETLLNPFGDDARISRTIISLTGDQRGLQPLFSSFKFLFLNLEKPLPLNKSVCIHGLVKAVLYSTISVSVCTQALTALSTCDH